MSVPMILIGGGLAIFVIVVVQAYASRSKKPRDDDSDIESDVVIGVASRLLGDSDD